MIKPGRCPLCNMGEEIKFHMVLDYFYAKRVWIEIEGLTCLKNVWRGLSIVEALKNW